MDPLIGATLIGGATSLLGGLFGSSAASKQAKADLQNARETRAFAGDQYDLGQLWNLVTMLGPEGLQMFKAKMGPERTAKIFGQAAANPNFSEAQRSRLQQIEADIARKSQIRSTGDLRGRQQYGDEIRALETERDNLIREAGGSPGVTGMVRESDFAGLGPGLVGEYGRLADEAGEETTRNLGVYDADTARLGGLARMIETGADRFGKQREESIRRDSAQALTSANQGATAALMSRGLGASTALTDAIGANTRQNFDATQDALGELGDQQIQLKTGLMTGRLGLLSNRLAGRQGVLQGGQDTQRQMRLGALNVKQQAVGGPVMYPWNQQNIPNYFPMTTSPSAAGLGTLAGTFAGMGSPVMGYGLMGLANQRQRPQTSAGGAVPKWSQQYWQ